MNALTFQSLSCALALLISMSSLAACSDDPALNNPPGQQDASIDLSVDVARDQEEDAADASVDASDMTLAQEDVSSDVVPDVVLDMPDEQPDEGPMPSAQGGDVCAQALDVSAGGVWTAQSTLNASDDYDSLPFDDGCPAGRGTGRDLTYVLNPATATRYRILVEPVEPNFDPMIYVREDCDQSVCVDGTVLNGPGSKEDLTLLVSDVPLFVIVDGESLSNGSFTLTVEALP